MNYRKIDRNSEAKRACVETMLAVAGVKGVAGVHVMGRRNEDILPQIFVDAAIRNALQPTIGAEL